MKIISKEVKSYILVYEDANGGYAFPCDSSGRVLWHELCSPVCSPDMARKSLEYCVSHQDRWTSKCGEVETLTSYICYGVCPCCGRRVYFGGDVSRAECYCGQWYNIFGQKILPPNGLGGDWRVM